MACSKHPALKGVILSAAEATFYDAVADAETAWQYADKSTQALARAADLTKHHTITAAAAVAAQAGSPNLGRPSKQAAHDLTGQWA